MGYRIEIFEKAALDQGYEVDRMSLFETTPATVKMMYGRVKIGRNTHYVRWNRNGVCFTHMSKPLPEFDLKL